jgi:NDP-sugar pyrophosphorylase family protein
MKEYGLLRLFCLSRKEILMSFFAMDLSKVAVVLLAGGQQTRFLEITDSIPKAMIGIGMRQRPSLEYLVNHLLAAGVGKIVIVAGFLSPVIMEHFFDWDRRGVKILFDPEGQKIDTGGAFRLALMELLQSGAMYDHVMYWNPDTLIQLNVQHLYQRHVLSGAASTVVLTTDSSAPNFGAVEVGADGMIISFDESRKLRSSRILHFDQYAHA